MKGFEPSRFKRKNLKLARLPIPSHLQIDLYYIFYGENQSQLRHQFLSEYPIYRLPKDVIHRMEYRITYVPEKPVYTNLERKVSRSHLPDTLDR